MNVYSGIEKRNSCCDDIVRVTEVLWGNKADTGIVGKVSDHEVFIQQLRGTLRGIKAILAFLGGSSFLTLLKLFKVI